MIVCSEYLVLKYVASLNILKPPFNNYINSSKPEVYIYIYIFFFSIQTVMYYEVLGQSSTRHISFQSS